MDKLLEHNFSIMGPQFGKCHMSYVHERVMKENVTTPISDWSILTGLSLTYSKYNEYNGCWYHIFREYFDLFMLEEPYHSLSLLVNVDTAEYIFRVFGTSKERGFYTSMEDLQVVVKDSHNPINNERHVQLKEIIQGKFSNTVACVGNPRLKVEEGAIQVEQPFSMTISPKCLSYYVISVDEEVSQGRGRCLECKNENPRKPFSVQAKPSWIDETGRMSNGSSNTDEDMKILNNDTPVKRKRGRPRKILPLDQLKKKRTLSDYTKKKIAENNKKFSICKLCKKQCKGFRGLVDHMHKDHSDYKPWQCSYCDVKTAFVKTLYRHLKQQHKVGLRFAVHFMY